MRRRTTKYSPDFGPVMKLETRALMTMVGPVAAVQGAADSNMTFPELDTANSPIAFRVDQTATVADAIHVKAGSTFTLTFPDSGKQYSVFSNKPALIQVVQTAENVKITALEPGFLGLRIASSDGSLIRYVGLYIGDHATGIVPDVPDGYLPVGAVSSPDSLGEAYFRNVNFQKGTVPIDYVYLYSPGGANYVDDGNLKGLLKQASNYGMVPALVYYSIQNMNNKDGSFTGVTEGEASAFQSVNEYDLNGQSLYTGYMLKYFEKFKNTLATIKAAGVPVQIVMEPDFLSYMGSGSPATWGLPQSFMPDTNDRTKNTVKVSQIYAAGLLKKGVDPNFDDNLKGFVEAINYAVAKQAPNARIGWKTNLWGIANQQNGSLGILHIGDKKTYPWQNAWSGPAASWADGQTFIRAQAASLAKFLSDVGTQTWTGPAEMMPFLAIDKYGVDGAYTMDPTMLEPKQTRDMTTAAFGDLSVFVKGAYYNLVNITDADTTKYFGLSKAELKSFFEKYNESYDLTQSDVKSVFSTLQNHVKADYNLAKWFLNSDQWHNYLTLVNQLSVNLGNTKVMLWQLPQGHINGSTSGGDLANTIANFQDSATTYFFGDTFKPDAAGLDHFSENQAGDPALKVSGNQVTWGEHMTLAQSLNVMSVLSGAGLGISTRGTPTPGKAVNDNDFFTKKATGYLKTKFDPGALLAGGAWGVTADQASWPTASEQQDQAVSLVAPHQATARIKPFAVPVSDLKTFLADTNEDGVPELIATGKAGGVLRVRAFDINTLKPVANRLANLDLPAAARALKIKIEDQLAANPGKEFILQHSTARGRIFQRFYDLKGRLLRIRTTSKV